MPDAPYDINIARLEILLAIREEAADWTPQHQVLKEHDLSPGTYYQTLEDFEDRGWIERNCRVLSPPEKDVRITEAGMDAISEYAHWLIGCDHDALDTGDSCPYCTASA